MQAGRDSSGYRSGSSNERLNATSNSAKGPLQITNQKRPAEPRTMPAEAVQHLTSSTDMSDGRLHAQLHQHSLENQKKILSLQGAGAPQVVA